MESSPPRSRTLSFGRWPGRPVVAPPRQRPRSAPMACSWCCRTRSHAANRRSLTPARARRVLDLRHRWQMIMKKDVSREIEELTGRKVIGFMSDNHIDPDLAVEVFVLEPLPSADAH